MNKLAVVVLAGLLLAGCSSSPATTESGTLTVFAAASLTESFDALERGFEADHQGVDVKFNYAGSSKLAQQINEGAPADVFASANQSNMDKVVDAGAAEGQPQVFATNRLTIAVAPGNPKGIHSFADLTQPGLTVMACAAQVPCGAATKKVEQASGISPRLASEEQNVKAVLRKVSAGEADAGLVYVSDARSAEGTVDAVDFPESAQAINTYPITTVDGSSQTKLGSQFIDYVRGPAGQRELTKAGFGPP